jgi:hypothetical protein
MSENKAAQTSASNTRSGPNRRRPEQEIAHDGCFPQYARITGTCNTNNWRTADVQIDERTVRKSLRELEALGLLQTVHRQARTGRGKRNMRNRYRILVGANRPVVVGANNPPNQEDNIPSSFRDLAMLLDEGDDHA